MVLLLGVEQICSALFLNMSDFYKSINLTRILRLDRGDFFIYAKNSRHIVNDD